MDKAALGYDYKSETEKHQSQKGEEAPTRVYFNISEDLCYIRLIKCVSV